MDPPESSSPAQNQASIHSSEVKSKKALKDVNFDADGCNCFAWRDSTWKEVPDRWDTEIPNLKIVTFNILFDLFDKDPEETLKRQRKELSLLRESNADLLALQEVTPGFLELLLQEQWVQQYYLSEVTVIFTLCNRSEASRLHLARRTDSCSWHNSRFAHWSSSTPRSSEFC